ncbi:MAG: CoA transferase [Hyphomicrobiales bacterium]|nr:MAG: CoA transferase [Hyphomicrobiales bacterium]
MPGVLEGIRVLDFGRYIAGPYCACMLAEHGAEVIRIEKRTASEDRVQAPIAPSGEGALFMQMNRNKLGMTLDPMKPEGQEIVRKLVATADVVVANLPPQTLEAMKLDYESLKAVKEDIILTTVTAYGRGGPYSDRVGFDGIGQAMSGAVYMTSEADGERPFRAQVPWVDFGTALHCAFGTMAALMARKMTGRGQWVEGALLATAVTFGNALLIEQAVAKPDRVPTANRGQTSGPVDLFKCKDGVWILVQVIGDPLYKRWANLMGEDMWLCDPRFKTDILRGDNGAVISERMAAWCAERTSTEAIETLAKAAIPSGPVLKPQQTLDDPHINAMGFFQRTEYPGMATPAPLAKVPVRMSATPGSIRRRPPTLGEHTDMILGKLGYDKAAIAKLREKKII